jgi:hypothetical protein
MRPNIALASLIILVCMALAFTQVYAFSPQTGENAEPTPNFAAVFAKTEKPKKPEKNLTSLKNLRNLRSRRNLKNPISPISPQKRRKSRKRLSWMI